MEKGRGEAGREERKEGGRESEGGKGRVTWREGAGREGWREER